MTAVTPVAAFELTDVVKRYGTRTVLDGIRLTVGPGQLVALLGPNGVGKTTLVEMLEGYRVPDAGSVRVLGQDPRRGGPELRARMGVMLQNGGLDPRSTPRDVLALYAALHERPRNPAVLMHLVGLDSVARSRVRRLSGGEKQRLALAVALVGDPEVLILDEPTAGMDPEARQATRAVIADLHAEGRAILLTTHDLGDVERLADRVVILSAGQVVADGSPSELIAGTATHLRVRFAHAPTPEAAAALDVGLARAFPGLPVHLVPDDGPAMMRIEGSPPDPSLIAALASACSELGIQIIDLRAGAATLEERYLALTGDHDVESVA
ncbi:MAG: ABC transporter ATP-binding protein [Chloroflexota bacterium]